MLGLQETKSAGSPKTYSCVACSATFHNLASLLVHQATHASEISCQTESTLPTCDSCGSLFASKDLLEKHHCIMSASPASPAQNICECGEEFSCFTALEDHKKQHGLENEDKSDLGKIPIVPDSKIDSSRPVSDQVFHSLSPSHSNEKSESAPPNSNIDIKKTKSSADMEGNFLKPFESHSVNEEQVQILEKDTLKSSNLVGEEPGQIHEIDSLKSSDLVGEEQGQIHEMDTLKSTNVVGEEKVQICNMDTLKSSNVVGKEQVEIRETDTSKSSDVVGEEQGQILEMDTLKSFDVVGEEQGQILYMDTLKSSNVVGEEQVQILEQDTLKSSNVLEEQVQILEQDTLESSNVVGEEQVQILEKDTLNVVNHSVHDNEKSPESCEESNAFNKKSILKMLASAYMSHKQPVQMKQRNLPPRKVAPRAPIQPTPAMTISKPEPLENKSNMKKDNVVSVKTGKMLSKKAKIISVTQTLCPVVVLETRQKLFGRDNVEGKLQCRLCRRVFQTVDSLIMHHALHKKERVKFCLCCQEFVITVISVPENHVCADAVSGNSPSPGKKSVTPISPTDEQVKLFYCSFCKRGYTRRHRLKIHNCPYKTLKSSSTVGNQGHFKLQNMEECSRAKQDSKANQMSTQHIHIGVGTETIKMEEQNTDFSIEKKNQTGLKMQLKNPLNPPETLQPTFASVSNSKPTENSVAVPANMVEMKPEEKDKLVEKQWTMPLDDAEIDILIDVDQKDSDEDDLTDMANDCDEDEDVVIVDLPEDKEMNSAVPSYGFQVHVTNKGVKRFVCNGCQKSYSRLFTLKEHLKICEARKLEQNVEKTSDLPGPIKRFPCPQCGKFFSRKDNLNKHRRKWCHAKKPDSVVSSGTVESKTTPAAQENLFVLSPSTENQVAQQESTQNTSSSRNWGIMSLPSVLPRRVTCECGASFTCPRLLFEHLQVHAQESYICPHCGENLQSWMDFEAHQQLHKQSKIPANEQRGSQQQPRSFSQTVPSHAPTRPQQSAGFSALNKAQPPALLSPQHVNHRSFPETLTCHKCKKNFSLRSSLLRHIRLRCKGDTAGQRKHTCSRCGATFHNPLTLKVHIQSNTCKPAFKPIRCPVCVRWFSCLDGLKRHLVSHSRQTGVTCQICDHNCPTPQALEEHKRNVHGLINRMRPAEDTQELLSQAGTQSSPATPFQCPICLRNYPKLQSLKDHLRKVHRPKQPNPQPNLQPNLGTVEPVRSGQFQCQICSRSYYDIKSLKNHRRRVHRIVGAAFQSSKATEQNSTPNPFQCHICARSYPNVQSLRNHRRRVHGIVGGLELSRGIAQHNLYKCQICQRSYPDIVSLKNHTRRVHRVLGPVPETSMTTATTTTTTPTNDTDDDLEEKPIPFLHS